MRSNLTSRLTRRFFRYNVSLEAYQIRQSARWSQLIGQSKGTFLWLLHLLLCERRKKLRNLFTLQGLIVRFTCRRILIGLGRKVRLVFTGCKENASDVKNVSVASTTYLLSLSLSIYLCRSIWYLFIHEGLAMPGRRPGSYQKTRMH